ncbi:S1 family peptidase [Actinoplanes sp. NPDC026670]|uniref:S1 family peptidase n=1 Tax=Actinoplanes sp. NPDC026670 TaxID=3154700 RepID=UPI0033F1078B
MPRKALAVGLAAVVLGLSPAVPVIAVEGNAVTGTAYDFVAKVDVGAAGVGAGCTGALVAPQWVLTAVDCFAAAGAVAEGAPATPTTVTLGRADLTETDGVVAPVVRLVPHPDRGVVLAKLATPATGITPVTLAATPAAVGDQLTVAGYGRTATEWVPKKLHAATFGVTAADTATLTVLGASTTAVVCKGDAGGPALRTTSAGMELVAVTQRSWQGGCLAETETRRDATELRADDLAGWLGVTTGDVGIFGALADGHLTYTAIDSASGDQLGTVTSTAALPFTPKAMAALNADTVLITSTDGHLYRVDVTGLSGEVRFATPVQLDTKGGWTHDWLSFDGDGSLFGLAGDAVRRYTITSAKPGPGSVINNTSVGASGFTLKNFTTTGPDFFIGATAAGVLRGYAVSPAGTWTPYNVAASGWGGYTALTSPGNGLYYARTAAGGLLRFKDATPVDGNGADITAYPNDPVATSGWNQVALSAVPLRSYPQHAADLSVFGVDADNHLTYTATDSLGAPIATVASAAALPFTAKAIAALNYTTVLINSTDGFLYRVDVSGTLPALTFTSTRIDTRGGWTHDMLAYDGAGSLYGIASGNLRRYTLTSAKPVEANITGGIAVGAGFTLKTLTTAGPGWILGTVSDGRLVSYKIIGAGDWDPYTLKTTGWAGYTRLTSPGNGQYYAVSADNTVTSVKDAAPLDGVGTDITVLSPAPGTSPKWTSKLVSAVPYLS